VVIPDLVVLGNLLVDDVVLPDGTTRMGLPGGAALYVALGASLWGLRVGVVSVRGPDYPADALGALTVRGVDVSGIRATDEAGLRAWLLYEGRRRQVVHRLDGPVHTEVSPTLADVPEDWRAAAAFHLAPVPLDLQLSLVTGLGARPGTQIALDPYEIVTEETLGRWRPVLQGVDALLLSEDDLDLPGVRDEPHDTLRGLCAGRLAVVLFKRGARGGVLYDARGDRFLEWVPGPGEVVDPTGAGDAFAGGFLAGWLRGEALARALLRGVVSAGFAIEDWGPAGRLRASAEEAAVRLERWAIP
jgi:sugar/nucleoside kinase (ribokinase family)